MTTTEAAVIRDYRPKDFEAIKRIHEASGLDYNLPELDRPIFIVKKVMEVDGVVRAALATYIQAELYLWLDKSDWGDPEQKFLAIKALDREVMEETWLKGVDCAVLWLPPNMESFAKRLTKDFGFTKDRDGWVTFSKPTKDTGVYSENHN